MATSLTTIRSKADALGKLLRTNDEEHPRLRREGVHAPHHRLLARLHVIPSRVDAMLTRMNHNADSYVEAELLGLLTLNWKLVATKPA